MLRLNTDTFPKTRIHGKTLISYFVVILILNNPIRVYSWGFTAHKKINETAVYTLPPELFKFYKPFVEIITEKAVNADMRRYIAKGEACKHFLDADHYEKQAPLDTIPPYWQQAISIFSKDSVERHGIVPWNLQLIQYQLTQAFETKNLKLIIKLSADLGHYAGDLHVPLHSTSNYNGQKTGQDGIHALWESRLFEIFNSDYDFFTGRAIYIDDINATIWQRFSESFAALDSVLEFERLASIKFPEKYRIEFKGNNTVKVYDESFCNYYHTLLNGMVERRFRASIALVGSLWYTAWVNAGQPNLSDLKNYDDDESDIPLLKSIIQTAQMLGRKED